jgi:hypothetical protein
VGWLRTKNKDSVLTRLAEEDFFGDFKKKIYEQTAM